MQSSHAWSRAAPTFDDGNLVSFAGLVPVLGLAERAGLSQLIGERVRIDPAATRVRSAAVNPAGKITSIIAGMAAGADSIDDLDVIRSGGMGRLFGGVYACATLGQFLREFTHGHTQQLASVARAHLVNLVAHTGLLPGVAEQAYVDIDSLLRPVYGHQKHGSSDQGRRPIPGCVGPIPAENRAKAFAAGTVTGAVGSGRHDSAARSSPPRRPRCSNDSPRRGPDWRTFGARVGAGGQPGSRPYSAPRFAASIRTPPGFR